MLKSDRLESISFQALTPIWTGDAFGESNSRTLETGIIGSLRWWTEALVRGMGVPVDDPTASKEPYDQEKNPGNPVERIYGFTGWRRRFRVNVTTPEAQLYLAREYRLPEFAHDGKVPSWPFRSKAWRGRMKLNVLAESPRDIAILRGTLGFAASIGAIGAKSQHGCGIVACEKYDSTDFLAWMKELFDTGPKSTGDSGLPSLRNLFTSEYAAKEGEELEDLDTFRARYHLRRAFGQDATPLRHFLFGKERGDTKQGSKVCVSFPMQRDDKARMRVWGWIPAGSDRNEYLQRIEGTMNKHYKQIAWLDLEDWYDGKSHLGQKIKTAIAEGHPWI